MNEHREGKERDAFDQIQSKQGERPESIERPLDFREQTKQRILSVLRHRGNSALKNALIGDGSVWLNDETVRMSVRNVLDAFQAVPTVINLTPNVEELVRNQLDLTPGAPIPIADLDKVTALGSVWRKTELADDDIVCFSRFSNLHSLYLLGSSISDAGLKGLEKLTGLTTLNLNSTSVTDEGLKSLEKLTGLTRLDLRNTSVTRQGVAALKQSLGPSCSISA